MPKVIKPGSVPPSGSPPEGLKGVCSSCGAEFLTTDCELDATAGSIVDLQRTIHGWRIPCPECGYKTFIPQRTQVAKHLFEKEISSTTLLVFAEDVSKKVYQRLIPQLENKGWSIQILDKIMQPGMPLIQNIEKAVERSNKVVIVLSPEVLHKLSLDLIIEVAMFGAKPKLIPILMQRCNLPMRIALLQTLDFTGDDPEKWNWNKLFESLKN